MKIKVKKASGVIEDLNLNKLRTSLTRSGADKDRIEEVIERILLELEPHTSTKKIYSLASKYLRIFNHASGLRYSLKRALFRLGPSGYHFEKYFGEILRHHGYQVETGTIMQGKCVKHEVDVFAMNDSQVSLIECKYHNRSGAASDIKDALYIYSRFRDLGFVIKSKYPDKHYTGWLVTNTRFTSDAIQYAECTGLKVLSWGYPENNSLEKMIEDKKLYPVTIISRVKSGLIKTLFEHNIILLKNLAEMDVKKIKTLLSLPEKKAVTIKEQADQLCL